MLENTKVERAIQANLKLQKLYMALEAVDSRLTQLELNQHMSAEDKARQLHLLAKEAELNAKIREEIALASL